MAESLAQIEYLSLVARAFPALFINPFKIMYYESYQDYFGV